MYIIYIFRYILVLVLYNIHYEFTEYSHCICMKYKFTVHTEYSYEVHVI